MDSKKITGWLYLVATLWYMLGVFRLTESGVVSGIIFLCLGSAFFCFASARANMEHKKNETEEGEDN